MQVATQEYKGRRLKLHFKATVIQQQHSTFPSINRDLDHFDLT